MAVTRSTITLTDQLRVRIDRTASKATRQLVAAWARGWEEIRGAWAAAAADLAARSVDGAWPPPWVIARAEQAQEALTLANARITALADYTGVTVTNAAGQAVAYTTEAEARIIASQFPPRVAGTRAELTAKFNRVSPAAVDSIIARTTQQIEARTWVLEANAQEAMRRSLVRGVAVGDNPKVAARRMVAAAKGQFAGGLTRAMNIARTEILDAHRAAAAETQYANADVLAGWVWTAKLDTRTCPSCWSQHGTRYPLSEPGPLDHQQGRCARTPVTLTWAELGYDIPEPPSLLPDARATFDDLPETDRVAIMGRRRLTALDAGDVTWGDLSARRTTPGWRDSYAPTPLARLLP